MTAEMTPCRARPAKCLPSLKSVPDTAAMVWQWTESPPHPRMNAHTAMLTASDAQPRRVVIPLPSSRMPVKSALVCRRDNGR